MNSHELSSSRRFRPGRRWSGCAPSHARLKSLAVLSDVEDLLRRSTYQLNVSPTHLPTAKPRRPYSVFMREVALQQCNAGRLAAGRPALLSLVSSIQRPLSSVLLQGKLMLPQYYYGTRR